MRPDIATLLQGLQGDSSVLANLLANMGASSPQTPDAQQPQQLPQMTAPQGPSFDLSAAPALYMPQMASSNPIAREQVTATATSGVGAGVTPSGASDGEGRAIYEAYLRDHGVSDQEIAAAGMNIQDESGWNPAAFNPNDPNGGALGYMQWQGDRRTGLINMAKSMGLDPSDPVAQAAWTVHERNGPEAANWAKVAGAPNVGEAGAAFVNHVERPAERYATERAARYRSTSGNAAPSGDTPMATKQVANSPASHIVSFLQDAFGVKGGAGDTAVNGGGGQDTLAPVTATATATGGVGAGAKASGMAEWLDNVFKAKPQASAQGSLGVGVGANGFGAFNPGGNRVSAEGGVGVGANGAGTIQLGQQAANPLAPALSALGLGGSALGNAAVGAAGATGDALSSLFGSKPAAKPSISATGSATGPVPGTQTTTSQMDSPAFQNDSDLAALMPDASPEALKKARNALTWQMIGTGLGQMSHGDRVDLSSVINEHVRRQEVAQQRVAEIAMERQRRFERAQTHGWDQEAQAADQAFVQAQNQAEADAKAAEEAAKAAAANAAAVASQNAYAAQVELFDSATAATIRAASPLEGAALGQQTVQNHNTQMGTAANQATSQAAADEKTVAERKATASAMLQPALRLAMDPTVPKEQRDAALSHVAALVPITRDGLADPKDVLAAIKPSAPLVSNTVNAGGSKMPDVVKESLTRQEKAVGETADKLASVEGSLRVTRAALDKGLQTGGLQDRLLGIRQLMADVGLIGEGELEGLQGQELLKGMTARMAPVFRFPGSQSDMELQTIMQSVPGLSQSEDTNKLLTDTFLNQITEAKAKRVGMSEFIDEQSKADTPSANFDAYWKAKQDTGQAPSAFYMADYSPASTAQIEAAYNNGFIDEGSMIIVQPGGVGEAILMPMSSDLIALMKEETK